MKKALLCLSFFCALSVFSQKKFVCGEDQQQILRKFNMQTAFPQPLAKAVVPPQPDQTKYVFNVKFHVVYNDDGVTRTNALGQPGLVIGEAEVMQAIAALNMNFNQFFIYFKYYGLDQVNDSDYLMLETNAEQTALVNSAYSDPEAFDIYIINGTVAGAAARVTCFDDDWFTPWTVTHEMGHNFGLVHPNASNPGCDNMEHAPRDPMHADYNASTKGDQVADTHVYVHSQYFDANCNYLGGVFDCKGNEVITETINGYVIKPGLNNFMYAEDDTLTCDPVFTPGQGVRMRQAITGYWANAYNEYRNDEASLYYPFEQRIVAGDIVNTQPAPGGLMVCRETVVKLRFQTGFDAHYSALEQTPSTVTTNPHAIFEYDNRLDYCIGVKLDQVNPVNVVCVGNVSAVYPYLCSFEPFVSGELYRMPAFGSSNITVQKLNQAQVNDPALFDSLNEKFYYVLKQETASGAVNQQVFYKQ